MHAAEMEAEQRKLRLFTDSRFKLKSDHYEKSVKQITEHSEKCINEMQKAAFVANEYQEEAMKYRLQDFTMQLDSRVTKEYVAIIGKQIEASIIDSFDRKNEDTLEKLNNLVNAIQVSQN